MSTGLTKTLDRIIKRHGKSGAAVVAVCQDVQDRFGYIPERAVRLISERLRVPASRVFSVVMFYSAFTLTPQGRSRVQVCLGTACHIKGGGLVADRVERELSLRPGETTRDGSFSFHTVRCLGCCALAPVMKINNAVYAEVTPERVPEFLRKHT